MVLQLQVYSKIICQITTLIFKIILILALAYGVWRGYEYVVNEIPRMMEEKIKDLNPLKGIKLGDSNE